MHIASFSDGNRLERSWRVVLPRREKSRWGLRSSTDSIIGLQCDGERSVEHRFSRIGRCALAAEPPEGQAAPAPRGWLAASPRKAWEGAWLSLY